MNIKKSTTKELNKWKEWAVQEIHEYEKFIFKVNKELESRKYMVDGVKVKRGDPFLFIGTGNDGMRKLTKKELQARKKK